jgi:phage baseplate assembly protein W
MARLTPRTKQQEFFSDFTSNLSQVPGRTDVARIVNESAVKESIKNLVLTDRGERLFQPDIGCDIRGQLFENITSNTIVILKENIKSTIKTYEPRCNLRDVIVGGDIDSNSLNVTILFSVINSNRDSSLTIDLSRVR